MTSVASPLGDSFKGQAWKMPRCLARLRRPIVLIMGRLSYALKLAEASDIKEYVKNLISEAAKEHEIINTYHNRAPYQTIELPCLGDVTG